MYDESKRRRKIDPITRFIRYRSHYVGYIKKDLTFFNKPCNVNTKALRFKLI